MSISEKDLSHLERLARIELEPGERESVRQDLSRVLEYFTSLSELDTSDVDEMVRPVPLTNVLREDEVRESLPRETTLALGVEVADGFFKVPRTVDSDG